MFIEQASGAEVAKLKYKDSTLKLDFDKLCRIICRLTFGNI